jgi:hypothetical protein
MKAQPRSLVNLKKELTGYLNVRVRESMSPEASGGEVAAVAEVLTLNGGLGSG